MAEAGPRRRGDVYKRQLFRIGAHPQSLIGVIYDQVKRTIEVDMRIEVCGNPECQAPFGVHDDRMRFCSKPCRARARYIEMKTALAKSRGRRTGARA